MLLDLLPGEVLFSSGWSAAALTHLHLLVAWGQSFLHGCALVKHGSSFLITKRQIHGSSRSKEIMMHSKSCTDSSAPWKRSRNLSALVRSFYKADGLTPAMSAFGLHSRYSSLLEFPEYRCLRKQTLDSAFDLARAMPMAKTKPSLI